MERKVRKKRRLIIDEQKSIASETMKIQLSDTSEIVTTLDLAPPTKKLMHWKETGGVEKLFAFPGRQITSRRLAKLFTNNLVTRSAATEYQEANSDVGYLGYSGVEHVSTANNSRAEVTYHQDNIDMPELPLAAQESYGMPASVAPCIVDDLTLSIDPADQSSRISLLPSDSSCLAPVQHDHASPTQPTPDEMNLSTLPSPPAELVSTLASYEGSGNSDDDYDDACDVNDEDSDVEPDGDITLEPVDDADVVEAGKEAEAEERRWNKRSQQMLMVLNKCLHRHDSVTFRQMAPPSATHSRKQAAAKFYTFLVLKKMEAIDVTQELPYGDILISRGPKFELLG